ncbi:MAG: DUF3592 domain-containing protein [Actinomycetota bacterium]|nr:DUF3592 domain-containing protein [Actinomycetota bacterium]
MSTTPQPVDESGVPYEELSGRTGAGGWLMALLHFAIGAVTLALALELDLGDAGAAFANDVWRVVFGVVGGLLVFLALRAMVRTVRAEPTTLTLELQRRAAMRGRALIVVGVAFFCIGVGVMSDWTIALEGWTKPFYVVGGVYLVLMGLVFQWNPTRHIRQQRVRQGQGRPGVARIVRANDTGTSVNDAPQVKIEFELEVGGRTYEVSDKIVMERAKLALLIPGSTVNVLVDRVDPNVFHVDWDSWKGPAAG